MRSSAPTAERRPVTALFADVVGSTTILEALDPEEWTEVMNRAFELMSQAVYRYEGTIAHLLGDGLLAFFGAPVAHEDDPERAVRAGLQMIDLLKDLSAQVAARHGIDFRVRVGINTGPVVVGNVGSDLRYEYTAIGDAVNVAARVQAAAAPGSVLVAGATYRFVAPHFQARGLGSISLKCREEPVHVYEVLGRSAAPARVRGIAGLQSPMVGRDADLRRLLDLLDSAAAGGGRAAFVVGEPGIGKSRLLQEFRARAGERYPELVWAEGRSLSHGRGLPYHLLLDLIRSLLGMPEGYAAGDGACSALGSRCTSDTRRSA